MIPRLIIITVIVHILCALFMLIKTKKPKWALAALIGGLISIFFYNYVEKNKLDQL